MSWVYFFPLEFSIIFFFWFISSVAFLIRPPLAFGQHILVMQVYILHGMPSKTPSRNRVKRNCSPHIADEFRLFPFRRDDLESARHDYHQFLGRLAFQDLFVSLLSFCFSFTLLSFVMYARWGLSFWAYYFKALNVRRHVMLSRMLPLHTSSTSARLSSADIYFDDMFLPCCMT